jgi:hypothetical protein
LSRPSLRSVCFDGVSFKRCLSLAVSIALGQSTSITKLDFNHCCFSLPHDAELIEIGLSRNTSVSHIGVVGPGQGLELYDILATLLASNSPPTFQHLNIDNGREHSSRGDWLPRLSSVFRALGKNTVLKTLTLVMKESMDESLCIAIKNGLGMNETLETLVLGDFVLTDANSDLWRRALSFLRTNKALKSLVVNMKLGVEHSRVATFRLNIAALLEENASLESLSIQQDHHKVEAKDFMALITALQRNKALKTFSINHNHQNRTIRLTDDEEKQMATLLKKNYAMESLPEILPKKEVRDMDAILRLNAAGRRYLIGEESSILQGVEVLCAVSTEINCVFLHLLENPSLCDRRAVEHGSAREVNSRSMNPAASSAGRKREPGSLDEGKKRRRRPRKRSRKRHRKRHA